MGLTRTTVFKWIDSIGAAAVLAVVVGVWIYACSYRSLDEKVLDENSELAELYECAAVRVLEGDSTIPPEEIEEQCRRAYGAACNYLGHNRSYRLDLIEGYDEVNSRVRNARLRYESTLRLVE